MCRSCVKKARRAGKVYDQHNYKMKTLYGITPEEYQEMLLEQGGACYICRRYPGKQRLAVDHDHEQVKLLTFRGDPNPVKHSIRGLLCLKCNRWLGHIQDSLSAISAAEEYLRRPKRWSSTMTGVPQ